MADLIRSDLEFIYKQILIAEAHPTGAGQVGIDLIPPNTLIPTPDLPWGLRTVDGTFNNLLPGNENFGAADTVFPRQAGQRFRNDADGDQFDPDGPGPALITNNNYASTVNVADADPRIISNLIVDQTANNPAAVLAAGGDPGFDHDGVAATPNLFFIPNVAPDAGLSAPFNSWMTIFGQFFDHGLDLLSKGGNGTVYIPLQPDDPLIKGADGILNDDLTTIGVDESADNLPPEQQFMALTRATNSAVLPGVDTILGTADDVHTHVNTTTAFVDQNQTYTSHASHQGFLREYVRIDTNGGQAGGVNTLATGKMLDGADGGLPTWDDIKTQAATMLGFALTDQDVLNVPMLQTDAYGKLVLNAAGFARIHLQGGGFAEGNAAANGGLGVTIPGGTGPGAAMLTGHAFLDDIAHNAAPGTLFDPDGPGVGVGDTVVQADTDTDTGNTILTDYRGRKVAYDDELLDRHFITGDGRGNENIALTTVHHVFHSEHNRQVDTIKATILATNDNTFIQLWLRPGGSTNGGVQADEWNGERLFQAARFATEMQYQHLVFEEFARKIQPDINVFAEYDITIDAAIVAEFAHTVYRFGHSMLTDTVARMDTDGSENDVRLLHAFLNPIEFNNSGTAVPYTADQAAGAVIRGMTRQVGNQIDEFITDAVRTSLVGLPLDLAAVNLARGRDAGVPTLNAARQTFYAATGDARLTPYESWVDFAGNLKNGVPSVINFIAAYGTHSELTATDVDTAAEKRAVAVALVMGGSAVINAGTGEERTFVADDVDRIHFLNSTGPTWSGTETGLNLVDFWVGGLAEKTMAFGSMLGATFNFVFETQLEKLQDGDRFYYLTRTAGLQFITALEQNSFASLIQENTDLGAAGSMHLPADIFSTPTWILELNQSLQHNDIDGNGTLVSTDPTNGNPVLPLVVRTATSLRYNGEDHVVLGGDDLNNTLTGGLGDDSLWGDGGNDRIEGRAGVDQPDGGAGDDIITDSGPEGDVLKGNTGNDVINGGAGLNLIIGGDGKDFIITGPDGSEAFAGPGNDFLYGDTSNLLMDGNEGDDWLEIGIGGGAGDNNDPFGLDPVVGHDVFLGSALGDHYIGEGGDDIMVGSPGVNFQEGLSGFDWTTYFKNTTPAYADMNFNAFNEQPLPPGPDAAIDRYAQMEGLSGSPTNDTLLGDNANALADITLAGATGSVLTAEGIARISGLQAILPAGMTSLDSGNIILGGGGSDLIEGRGGNDIIDGDSFLRVRISVRTDPADPLTQIESHTSLSTLQGAMLAGTYNPSQLVIVREIDPTLTVNEVDTAKFSDVRANYTVFQTPADQLTGRATVTHLPDPVTGLATGIDGTDTIRNIERLQFALTAGVDGIFGTADDVLAAPIVIDTTNPNAPATGGVTFTGDDTPATPPTENQVLTATNTFADPNGINPLTLVYTWQTLSAPNVWTTIGTGPSFTVTDAAVGNALRIQAQFDDNLGAGNSIFSVPTGSVININDVPTGNPAIDDPSPSQGALLTASPGDPLLGGIVDGDGTLNSVFTYQWQSSPNGTTNFTNVGGNGFTANATFTPTQAQVGTFLRVQARFTDDHGTVQTVNSVATEAVLNINDPPTGLPTISDLTPAVPGVQPVQGQVLTAATAAIVDVDGKPPVGTFAYQWQVDQGAGFVAIANNSTAITFTPTALEVGQPIRVIATYTDLQGTVENVASNPTANVTGVVNVNDPPTGAPAISDPTPATPPTVGEVLTASPGNIVDPDGVVGVTYSYQWQANTGAAGAFQNIGTGTTFTLGAAQVGFTIRVVASYTDNGGFANTATSTATAVVVAAGAGGTFTGDANANTLTGTAFNDVLIGLGGADTLSALGGADTLRGGAGKDHMTTGAGADIVDFDLTSESGVGSTLRDIVADFTPGIDKIDLSTIDASSLVAGNQDFAFIGAATAFSGTAGEVRISTSAVAGYTQILVNTDDAGTDTAANMEILLSGTPTVTAADFLGTFVPPPGGGTFTGDGNANTLTGTAFNDVLIGLGGNDTLSALGGVDTLRGGAGKDHMTGGAGADIFDFDLTSESGIGSTLRDIVADFLLSTDDIDLSTIDASSVLAGNQAFTFIGTAAFSGAAGQVRIDTAAVAGYTQVLINTDDAGTDTAANMEILLSGTPAVTAGDFIL